MKRLCLLILISLLAGCGSSPRKSDGPGPTSAKGGYYMDDGPGDRHPPDLDKIPDAMPRSEPLNRFANRPYQQFGKEFVPLAAVQPFRQRGMASWYGRRYHGQKTSVGEVYDMYKMSAAHPTLPIPSYARVTNVKNGRRVVVRINDRGPFLGGGVIDFCLRAANRLGYIQARSAEVEGGCNVPGAAPQTKNTVPNPQAESHSVSVQLRATFFKANDAS